MPRSRAATLIVCVTAMAAALTLTRCATEDSPSSPNGQPNAGVVLRSDGLEVVSFGDLASTAATELTAVLGPPDRDDSVTEDRPDGLGDQGSTLRTMRWGALAVSFLDWQGSPYRTDGRLHLVRWMVLGADRAGEAVSTADGVTVGSTATDVRRVYGDRLITERDECVGAWTFRLRGEEALGLRGRFDRDPADPAAVVSFLSAGLQSSC
jgi:hypothetical protein